MIYQTTITQSVSFEGIGLHTGQNSKIRILPADANNGIIFKRVDLNQNNLVEANYLRVTSAKLCTTLENKHGVKVSTVEHLLAALYIAEIDNAMIEINCEEVPILDGSAKIFLDALKKEKLKLLSHKRKYLKVKEKIELKEGDRKISIEPSEETLEVDFELNYKNKIIGKQKNNINFKTDDLSEMYSSRTFCLYEDIEKNKKSRISERRIFR